jgi:hypothetical protein
MIKIVEYPVRQQMCGLMRFCGKYRNIPYGISGLHIVDNFFWAMPYMPTIRIDFQPSSP